jgi:cyclophilin family peptidyl-prolyl cis-trans isomerase
VDARRGEREAAIHQNIMTKQHKAATEVTVAPLEERSALQEFVYAHWLKGLVAFFVVAIAIYYFQLEEQQAQQVNDQSWSKLGDLIEFAENPGAEPDPSGLQQAATELSGTLAGPWAAALVAPAHARTGEYAEALEAAAAFKSDHAGHLLNEMEVATAEGEFTGPFEALGARIEKLREFESENPGLFENPEPPQDAPRVTLETTEGAIEIALYTDLAPNHSANFLERVRSGLYDGNKFHRVIDGFMIQTGDPNSIDGDPSTWGTGGGDETQPQELSRLAHFPGYVSMAKRDGQIESSKAQFFITLGAPHHLDGQHTVFGKVTSGMDVVERIGSGAIAEGTTDRPADPVTIVAASER